MVKEQDKALMDFLRAMLRPILIVGMGLGTYLLIINNIDTEFAQWWMRIFFGGAIEWIAERPILKAIRREK